MNSEVRNGHMAARHELTNPRRTIDPEVDDGQVDIDDPLPFEDEEDEIVSPPFDDEEEEGR